MLSKVISKVSCWLGQDVKKHTLTSLGLIPKCSHVLPLREHPNLDRPFNPDFICKVRRAGVFYSSRAMLFLEE